MAHSDWMIPGQAAKPGRVANTTKKTASGSSSKAQSSFAAVMAKEQNGAASAPKDSKQTLQAYTPATESVQAAKSAASANKTEAVKTTPRMAPPQMGLPLHGEGIVLGGRTPNDMLRMQTFNKASSDIMQARNIDNFLRTSGSSSLEIARGMNASSNMRVIASGGNGKGFALASSDFIHTNNVLAGERASRAGRKRRQRASQADGIGKLSAKFESGSDGIAAIGYDRTGGTSYGKYQIASRVGSMKSFLAFLDGEAPDLSKRLRSSGPANTGSRRGAMPDEWRKIAQEQPDRFEKLQEAYIHESHYKPALDSIGKTTGVDPDALSQAMREVIWSTAVQHGPAGAARIFAKADDMSGSAKDASYERKLISNVYGLRAGQFGSSTAQVRNAVRNRFREEKELALNMLEGSARANRA